MPHNLAHLLYELRRKAGHSDFQTEESITVIRQINTEIELGNLIIQTQLRGPAYFCNDNGVRRNFVTNPSFEHDLISWTIADTATGSSSRDSSQSDEGSQSLLLNMTDSTASGEIISRRHVITGLAPSEVWSTSVSIRPFEFTTANFVLRMQFLSAADAVLATHNVAHAATGTSFVTITNENRTAPASTAKLRISLIVASFAANATATVNCDAVIAEEASSIGSYFDGDSQNGFWEINAHNGESINDVDGTAIISGNWKTSA